MIINKGINTFTLMVCIVAVFICGCVSTPYNNYLLEKDSRIAVLPFTSYSQIRPEIGRVSGRNNYVEQTILKNLTKELITQLNQKEISNIIVLDNRQETLIKKQINADVIICSRILDYKERVGSEYAVGSPASVALEIKIVDSGNGKVFSRFEYKETQQALSENLFNLKKFIVRKGRWVKAYDLACYGIYEFVTAFTD